MAGKYPEIKKYILEQIENNNFKTGVMLPTEKEFTKLFNVSRMTVRRALDDLIQDGILIRKPGSGVFLAKTKIQKSMSSISTSQDKIIHQMYDNLTVKIIDFKIVHNHHMVRKYLGIENEDALQIKRVQFGDNHPIVYENIFLPVKYFSAIDKTECYQSFKNIVEKHFLLDASTLNHKVTVEAKVASKALSSLLLVPINSAILQLDIIATGLNGEKYYCGINSYSGDNFSYSSD